MSDNTEERPNVTAETIAEFKSRIRQAMREKDRAVGLLRAEWKAAKKAGVNIDALKEVMAIAAQDDGEAQAIYERDRARYAAWLGVPLGTQGALFDDAPVSQKAQDLITETDAYDVGVRAGRAGRNGTDCPYPAGTLMHQAWSQGWMWAQNQRAMEMKVLGDAEPTAMNPPARPRGRPRKTRGAEASA